MTGSAEGQPRCAECIAPPGPLGRCVYHPDGELLRMSAEDAEAERALLVGPARKRHRLLAAVFLLCSSVVILANADGALDALVGAGIFAGAELLFALPVWAWRRGAVLRGRRIGQAPAWLMGATAAVGWVCAMASFALYHRTIQELPEPVTEAIFAIWLATPPVVLVAGLGSWGWSAWRHRAAPA